MRKPKDHPKSPVDAVQQVYDALEPFDDAARRRILESASSLLGMRPGSVAEGSGKAPPHLSQPLSSQVSSASLAARPVSPVELIQEKQPVTNAQRIVLFAYYREKVEGLSRFSREDLAGYFAKARQPPPENYNRDFRTAVELGWIHEDGNDSYLTTKGLD
jgi:hypothetical protein